MGRKGNHLLNNEDIQNKIAYLLSINKAKRDFVASKLYKNDASFILNQILCQSKATKKLPTFFKSKCYYTQKSIEQATSENVANWKVQFILSQVTNKSSLISLTGGLGVDDYFFSLKLDNVISVDPDLLLNQLVDENLKLLNANNITRITSTCEEYLLNEEVKNTLVYIDPDRRPTDSASNKQVTLFSPNILEIIPNLIKGSNDVFIKLSGATDIDWIENNIPFIKSISVLSEQTEVKEILLHLASNASEQTSIQAVNITSNSHASQFSSTQILKLKTQLSGSKLLFRPLPAITKTNLLRDNSLSISPNVPYYLTDSEDLKAYGQVYQIEHKKEMSLKQTKAYLKQNKITEASVISRNGNLTSAQVKQFLGLKESPSQFLFIFGLEKMNKVIFAKKL